MSSLSPASEVILRHLDHFADRHVLIAGDLQDTFAAANSGEKCQSIYQPISPVVTITKING